MFKAVRLYTLLFFVVLFYSPISPATKSDSKQIFAVQGFNIPKNVNDPVAAVATDAFASLGYELIVYNVPRARAYKFFVEEDMDVFLGRTIPANFDYENYAPLSQPYATVRYFVYCLKEKPCDHENLDVIGGYIRGYGYLNSWLKSLPDQDISRYQPFLDTTSLIGSLFSERVEYIVSDEQSMFINDLSKPILHLLQRKPLKIDPVNYTLVLRKRLEHLEKPLSLALKEELKKSAFYQKFPVLPETLEKNQKTNN